jgi:superfamily I DNA/RNA helicase
VNGLRKKGLQNLSYVDYQRDNEPSLLNGLTLLLENKECNLGWRIVAELLLPEEDFKKILEKTTVDSPGKLIDLIPKTTRTNVKKLVATLRKIKKAESVADEGSTRLFQALDLSIHQLAQKSLRDLLPREPATGDIAAIRNIPIKVATIPSSKGLAEDYIFITDFDDRFFLEKDGKSFKVTDQKIYDFLVALTRARKKVFLISCDKAKPTFLKWIDASRIETATAA